MSNSKLKPCRLCYRAHEKDHTRRRLQPGACLVYNFVVPYRLINGKEQLDESDYYIGRWRLAASGTQ
jgi:hypothetical protein